MTAGDRVLRLPRPWPCQPIDGYDFDALCVVFDGAGDVVDFRLGLGSGLDIYSCTPAARKDKAAPEQPDARLILMHVDCAVAHIDEPTLVSDPCLAHFTLAMTWTGTDLPDFRLEASGRSELVESVHFSCVHGDYVLVVGLRSVRGLRGAVMRNTAVDD
jgi:hypothetical protein